MFINCNTFVSLTLELYISQAILIRREIASVTLKRALDGVKEVTQKKLLVMSLTEGFGSKPKM